MAALFQKLSRAALKVLIAFVVIYGTFILPIGRYTFAGHLIRIVTTPEAHQFAESIGGSVKQLGRSLIGVVRRSLEPGDDDP